MPSASYTLDYQPKLPDNRDRGIGIVGAGEIITAAHLPAYRKAGFNIVGIYDRNRELAERVAQQFDIHRVYHSLDELLSDSDVQIVDIALPVKFQSDVVATAATNGKHVLCQKPLGENFSDAKRIVEIGEEADVRIAVNHQMRWAPAIQACKSLTQQGLLGKLTQANIQVNVFTDWSHWEWLTRIEQLEIMYHSIHYLDAIRYLLGTPEYIYADAARFPGQRVRGETRTLIHMKFPGECRGLIQDNHNNISPSQDDWYATFRLEGTEGIAKGTNGALYNYPTGQADTLSYFSKRVSKDSWISPNLEGRWFPDAFMGTMGELMRAIDAGREPENSARDGLKTIQMVFAAYRSIAENRPVHLDEIEY